jgi:hypothetical protein
MYEWDDNYGDASAYGGYDQQQQDYLQNALDAADLQTTLDSSGPGGGQTVYDLDPYAVGGQYDIANASTKKVLNDDNTTTYTMPDGSKFKFDPTSKTYTPEGSSTPFDANILNKIGTGLYNTFKTAFTKKNAAGEDVTDWGKVLAAAGAAASVTGRFDQPKTPVGYQGGIPSLVASRAEVPNTYDPNRRAGSSGQRYFSNSVYSAPDKATGVQAALEQQATALAGANKANPAGDFAQKIVRTTPDTYTGMRSMSPSGTLGQALTPEQIAAQTKKTAGMASGGIASARYLRGETDGMEDKIPARIGKSQPAALSHGEFVVPADVVSHLGNGNSDAGAKKLYQMMDRIREARTGTKKQGKQINPDKFMPGGSVRHKPVGLAAIDNVSHFTVGGNVNVSAPNAAGTESNLSNWAGPAVTRMVGEAEAITAQPYKAYSGPLTAGASSVQNQAFQNAANLTIPTGNMGGFQPSTFGAQEAQNYMNPYLMSALNPQLEEARRQSQITQLGNQAKATQAGAFGGGRSAIMEAETQRNLGTNLANITGTGYKDAYDKAMQQFNTEQGRGLEAQNATNTYGLAALARQQDVGAAQREIEQQGITADMKQFEEEKDDPYKQLMRKQAIFQGLPITAQAAVPQTQTGAQQAGASIADVTALLKQLKLID